MAFWDWFKSLFSMNPTTIINTGWEWLHVETDGNDLVVQSTIATWFGGNDDPQDNGETASGVNTKDNPTILGCALPRNYTGSSEGLLKSLGNSPIPHKLPFKTLVQVTNSKDFSSITVPFIDIGPARSTKHGLDLTQQAFKMIGGDLAHGTLNVSYRIIGGAQYI